jgi:hypothetical protein
MITESQKAKLEIMARQLSTEQLRKFVQYSHEQLQAEQARVAIYVRELANREGPDDPGYTVASTEDVMVVLNAALLYVHAVENDDDEAGHMFITLRRALDAVVPGRGGAP